ncbi:MAG: 2-dehydropantoate 2-reductase [Deltaproteobacteria bacterium]|nr:2-dehydropantoate 2-reductase [Deltaproteobacteria bacterium]
MHFLIVGPGAMGCLFAAGLKRAGCDVTLWDYKKERAEQINRQGIVVEGIRGAYTEKVLTVTGNLPLPPDVVLMCVKSYSTRDAGQAIKPWLEPKTAIVTLQNGVGNVEILEQMFGREAVFGGTTAEGATLLGPGKIRHAGQGETIVGPGGKPENIVEKIVSSFGQAGFQARSADHVDDFIWGKLIINVGINALSAITKLKNGRLPELHSTRQIMAEAVKEAVVVATAKKIQLPYPNPFDRVLEVCRATAGNVSSMLQDVLNEKTTEVDFINGAIVREGNLFGIPTPVNFTLTSLVLAIQEIYLGRI